jgi:uncharacterized protein
VRAQTPILIMLVCAMVAASTLPGCVTTHTGAVNNSSKTSTTVSGRAVTKSSAGGNSSTARSHYVVTIGSTMVNAESASTPAELETGLMNRTFLNENSGMLFVFPTEQKQSFWMKNMRIPLDIVFITEDMHVLNIYQSVPPCSADPCVSYASNAPIKYALEVNAGLSAQHGITIGDTVLIAPAS